MNINVTEQVTFERQNEALTELRLTETLELLQCLQSNMETRCIMEFNPPPVKYIGIRGQGEAT